MQVPRADWVRKFCPHRLCLACGERAEKLPLPLERPLRVAGLLWEFICYGIVSH